MSEHKPIHKRNGRAGVNPFAKPRNGPACCGCVNVNLVAGTPVSGRNQAELLTDYKPEIADMPFVKD